MSEIKSSEVTADTRREERYDPQRIEKKWSERWAEHPELFRADAVDPAAQEVLRAGDAALSQRRPAHGPRAELLDRRRPGAPHVDARL